MTAPAAVLAAIAAVSGRIVCVERCGAVELAYDAERDVPAISHPYADCPNVLDPDSDSALALATYAQERLSAYVALADYGEPLPLNSWAVS